MISYILHSCKVDKEFLHPLQLFIIFTLQIFQNRDTILNLKSKRMN